MAVTAATPVREHERPMSWARAVLIAVGFFFITAILAGQLPSYIYNQSTAANLFVFQQAMLTLSALAIGIGLLCFEISFLYDPKPLLPWPLFALAGLGLGVIGAFITYMVGVGEPGTTIFGQPGWPAAVPTSGYLINPGWFQALNINLNALGLIALTVGLAMFVVAALNPWVLSGRILGPARDLIVRFGIGLSVVLLALYLTLWTFWPQTLGDKTAEGYRPFAATNIMLYIALAAGLVALLTWLLPVMTANRQRFMPGVYLHGVVGLIGNVGVPLFLVWVLTYPVVDLIHGADSEQFWVSCSQKTAIPASCTFTQFTGYIICTIVFSVTVGLLIVGLFFWNSRRDTVVLGGTIGLIYVGLAVAAIHVGVPAGTDPSQTAMGLLIAAAIIITAFVWTWGTQREFAPTRAEQLGCTGQWLVLGTLLLIYLFGFAVFSLPNFYEIEALALFYQPGHALLHDAFWVMLLMGGAAALQMCLLIKKRPMSGLRKFALWVMLGAVALMVIASIQGFHRDILTGGINAMESAHAIFITGMIFGLVGLATTLYGAFSAGSTRWLIGILVIALLGVAFAIVCYTFSPPYPELVQFGFIFALAGAFAYTALGPDYLGEEAAYAANGANGANGNGAGFVVTR